MLNKVMLIGRLGQDPELKTLGSGNTVANFSVATNEKWTDKDGKKHEKPEWHNVVVWGKLAETCARHLTKGSLVHVEGKLQTRSWDDNEGKKRYATEIVGQSVQFLDSKREPAEDLPMFGTGEEIPF